MSAQGGRFGASRLGAGGELLQQEMQSRPLPSQRAGSYQSQAASNRGGRFGTASPPPSNGTTSFGPPSSGATAQDRLKARLWGAGRTASPPPSNASTPSIASSGSRSPYENMGPSLGGGVAGENPYAPQQGASSRYGGSGATSQGRPSVGANSPWSGGGEYDGGGGSAYEQGNTRSGVGLPSGPRVGRQGVGLPNGPRPQRF